MTVLYADCTGDTMRIDGYAFGEWVRGFPNLVIFTDCFVNFQRHILPHLRDSDYAIGGPGGVIGVTLRSDRRTTRIYCGDTWGCNRRDAQKMAISIEGIRAACAEQEVKWKPTAASTAMAIVREKCARYFSPGLPARFRALATAAIHAGPIIHARAGGYGSHIDRRRAYFHAMTSYPMPCGTPIVCSLQDAMKRDGIVDCDVTVPYHDIPPLPVRTQRNNIIYPHGKFRGVYPTNVLKCAIEHYGVKLGKVHGAIRWPYRCDALRLACEVIDRLPKWAAKPMYTRIWGKLASNGGWKGRLDPDKLTIMQGNGLGWTFDGVDPAKKASPMHRPDIAAWIVGQNHAAMFATLASMKGVIATHVDAIWSDGANTVQTGERDGDWKVEGTGKIRYFAPGQYVHRRDNGEVKVGFAGWQHAKLPNADEVEKWAGHPDPDDNRPSRIWCLRTTDITEVDRLEVSPRSSPDAISVPRHVDNVAFHPYSGNSPFDASLWNADGTERAVVSDNNATIGGV